MAVYLKQLGVTPMKAVKGVYESVKVRLLM